MAVQIAFFNHKGGVAKTTSAFHIGWKLAELGHRVMLVDGDPQCNLTGVVLHLAHESTYIYESGDPRNPKNIRDAVLPAMDARPFGISAVALQEVPRRPNLFILPGHVGFSEFESRLAIAHDLSSSLPNFQNIPGALRYAFDQTAKENGIDFVLVDMSPSLGAINQNLLMTSDFFIIPMAPDYFSAMGLSSLARVIPEWRTWS